MSPRICRRPGETPSEPFVTIGIRSPVRRDGCSRTRTCFRAPTNGAVAPVSGAMSLLERVGCLRVVVSVGQVRRSNGFLGSRSPGSRRVVRRVRESRPFCVAVAKGESRARCVGIGGTQMRPGPGHCARARPRDKVRVRFASLAGGRPSATSPTMSKPDRPHSPRPPGAEFASRPPGAEFASRPPKG